MLKAIAIDDEPPALNLLQKFCNRSDQVELIEKFTRATAADRWLVEHQVDLLFLDIHLPAVSGLDFYRNLPEKMMVIFTTAHGEYAVEGFNLRAIDYLLKPFTYDRFIESVVKAVEYRTFQQRKQEETIQVRSDYSKINIPIGDILYIEAYSDYLKIHTENQKTVVTRMTMSSLLEMLPPQFIRTHRSFIVSIQKIRKIKGKEIFIGDAVIPIGRTYLETVQRAIL